MANEITVVSHAQITKRDSDTGVTQIDWSCRPVTFQADFNGTKGPTPGSILVSPYGTTVDLSQIDTRGLCRIHNTDLLNYITWGIMDPETSKYYPIGKVKPGESYVFRLADELGYEYGTGSGTSATGPNTNRFRMRANAAYCQVIVEAFDD